MICSFLCHLNQPPGAALVTFLVRLAMATPQGSNIPHDMAWKKSTTSPWSVDSHILLPSVWMGPESFPFINKQIKSALRWLPWRSGAGREQHLLLYSCLAQRYQALKYVKYREIHEQLEVSLANSINGQRLQSRKDRTMFTACGEDSHSLLSFSSRLAVSTCKHYSIQRYIYIYIYLFVK